MSVLIKKNGYIYAHMKYKAIEKARNKLPDPLLFTEPQIAIPVEILELSRMATEQGWVEVTFIREAPYNGNMNMGYWKYERVRLNILPPL